MVAKRKALLMDPPDEFSAVIHVIVFGVAGLLIESFHEMPCVRYTWIECFCSLDLVYKVVCDSPQESCSFDGQQFPC